MPSIAALTVENESFETINFLSDGLLSFLSALTNKMNEMDKKQQCLRQSVNENILSIDGLRESQKQNETDSVKERAQRAKNEQSEFETRLDAELDKMRLCIQQRNAAPKCANDSGKATKMLQTEIEQNKNKINKMQCTAKQNEQSLAKQIEKNKNAMDRLLKRMRCDENESKISELNEKINRKNADFAKCFDDAQKDQANVIELETRMIQRSKHCEDALSKWKTLKMKLRRNKKVSKNACKRAMICSKAP